MRTLYYLQIFITLLILIYLFILRYEILIAILIVIFIQFLLLSKFNIFLPLIYVILNFAFVGLINLPIIGFVFAILYLLFSLFIASILKKTTFLLSSKYEFVIFSNKKTRNSHNHKTTKPKYTFSSIYEDLKRPYYFTKSKFKTSQSKKNSSSHTQHTKNSSNQKNKKNQDEIQDAEFYEK
ncbi:MAG: hypothetical protein ACMXYB_04575 [Candidatus Woesearchaeota archaeon]